MSKIKDRKIVLDTETTGLKISDGHRIIEIGCCEIINFQIGRSMQIYINPERDIDPAAFSVHGISSEFLKDKPKFKDIVRSFLDFIKNDPLIIHNARFDMNFLNSELQREKLPLLDSSRAIDTLYIARKKYPGSPASLDALCKKFSISIAERTKHGALLDAHLLAAVYIAMHDASQTEIEFHKVTNALMENSCISQYYDAADRKFKLNEDEAIQHDMMLKKLSDPIWNLYNTEQ